MTNLNLSKTLESITKISFDSSRKISLCISSKKIYNFDKICADYTKVNKIQTPPKSCDGLWINGQLCTLFEFKNGSIDSTIHEILKKAYDSLFILLDLNLEKEIKDFEHTISYSRENIDFTLVYNFAQNGKRYIHETVNKKAKMQAGDLKKMEKFLFHKVNLLTEEEFMKQIEPNI